MRSSPFHPPLSYLPLPLPSSSFPPSLCLPNSPYILVICKLPLQSSLIYIPSFPSITSHNVRSLFLFIFPYPLPSSLSMISHSTCLPIHFHSVYSPGWYSVLFKPFPFCSLIKGVVGVKEFWSLSIIS